MESGTEIFSKGTLVEVSSDEDGFKGAWYVATILESPPKSASKKRARALVEYQDLLVDEEVGSSPLREVVETSFLRPLPPPDASPKFCVGDVVDAFYRDGWWTGVITRFSEDSKCTVTFQNPPDEIEFHLSDLRVHKEWVDGNWIRPENKVSSFVPLSGFGVLLIAPGTSLLLVEIFLGYGSLLRRMWYIYFEIYLAFALLYLVMDFFIQLTRPNISTFPCKSLNFYAFISLFALRAGFWRT